jgi:hypothetical protein
MKCSFTDLRFKNQEAEAQKPDPPEFWNLPKPDLPDPADL